VPIKAVFQACERQVLKQHSGPDRQAFTRRVETAESRLPPMPQQPVNRSPRSDGVLGDGVTRPQFTEPTQTLDPLPQDRPASAVTTAAPSAASLRTSDAYFCASPSESFSMPTPIRVTFLPYPTETLRLTLQVIRFATGGGTLA
jgi:hypothetical protein